LEKRVVQNAQTCIDIGEVKAVSDGSSDDGCAIYGEVYCIGVEVDG
jgi:hypothetical protein